MPTASRRRQIVAGITSTGVVLSFSTVALAVLLRARPQLSGSPAAWRGDDLAFGTTWLIAIVCTAWLTLTTLACLVALARGERAVATRIAGFAPPLARRILQAALVSTFAFAPTAAHADAPRAPFTLHVGSGGRLTTVPDPGPSSEVPVVRAPPTTAAAPVAPHPSTTSTTITTPPRPHATAPAPAPAVEPTAPVAPLPPTAERTYVVRAGDNLWSIAKTEVMRKAGGTATHGQVARYWQHVVAANRSTLRSGDPSLIFPGEVVALPLD